MGSLARESAQTWLLLRWWIKLLTEQMKKRLQMSQALVHCYQLHLWMQLALHGRVLAELEARNSSHQVRHDTEPGNLRSHPSVAADNEETLGCKVYAATPTLLLV